MPDFKLISADSHVNEPPAAWERVQKQYGDRRRKSSKIRQGCPKALWLVIEGLPPIGLSHYSKGLVGGKDKGISAVEQEKHFETIRFNENFRYEDYPGGWEPAARLKDQDIDGIDAEILFSSAVRQLYSITDEAFQRAIFRSYNEWLHEFCSFSEPAHRPGDHSILDMDHTVADIHHYAKLGFRGVQIPRGSKTAATTSPNTSPCGRRWRKPAWSSTSTPARPRASRARTTKVRVRSTQKNKASALPAGKRPPSNFLGNMILSGVFDRHPKLKVVCAEFDAGWVANLVQQVDYWFGRASTFDAEKNINKLPPSEYFKRNAFFTYQDDRAGVLTAPVYGADNFLWASDYPHGVTTWPYSKETVDRNCEGIDPIIKRKLNRENAAKLYRLGQ